MSLSKSINARINKQPFGWNTNPPEREKEYYYRSTFAEHFPSDSAARSVPSEASVACSTAIALEWDAAFKNMNDPSGRAVKGVHEQAY